jgi:hypothetical protein
MKRTVWIFGGLSGLIAISMMLISAPLHANGTLDYSSALILGYTTIVLSMLLVFFGVRSYREKLGGTISFGKAFTVGLFITLISCVIYVLVWEIIYFGFMPNFGAEMANTMLLEAQKAGATAQEMADKKAEMNQMVEMLNNPFLNAAITFMEPFPIGLIVALVSAGILKRKPVEQKL